MLIGEFLDFSDGGVTVEGPDAEAKLILEPAGGTGPMDSVVAAGCGDVTG
jgi:hypothetical protein